VKRIQEWENGVPRAIFKEIFVNKHLQYVVPVFCIVFTASMAYADSSTSDKKGHCDSMHKSAKNYQMNSPHFGLMDTDGDGMVSKAEYDANHDKHFKELDTNSDGKLSPEEMRAGHHVIAKENMKKRFDKADANHDGTLSRDEIKDLPYLSRRFDELDTNKDGKLTQDELQAGWAKHHREHGNKDPKTNRT